jgi:hypothetical protein
VAECTNTVDGAAIVVTAMHLVKHGKGVHIGAAAVGTEGTVAAQTIVRGRLESPATSPRRPAQLRTS